MKRRGRVFVLLILCVVLGGLAHNEHGVTAENDVEGKQVGRGDLNGNGGGNVGGAFEEEEDKEKFDVPLLPAGEEGAGKEEEDGKERDKGKERGKGAEKEKVEDPQVVLGAVPVADGDGKGEAKDQDGELGRDNKPVAPPAPVADVLPGSQDGNSEVKEKDVDAEKEKNVDAEREKDVDVGKEKEEQNSNAWRRLEEGKDSSLGLQDARRSRDDNQDQQGVHGKDGRSDRAIPRPLASEVDEFQRIHAKRLTEENEYLLGKVRSLKQEMRLLRKDRREILAEKQRMEDNAAILAVEANDFKEWGEREEKRLLTTRKKAMRIKEVAKREHISRIHERHAKDEEIGKLEKEMEEEEVQKRIVLRQSQMLKDMLEEDEKMLKELKKKADNPDIKLWLGKRVKKVTKYLDNPETEAVADFAKRYFAGGVHKGSSKFSEVERKVEKGIGKMIPAKYGSLVGSVLTLILVGLPVGLISYAFCSFTTLISTRQYILLGNCFFTLFTIGLCAIGLLLWDDPLQTLYFLSRGNFVGINFIVGIIFSLFCLFIMRAIATAKSDQERITFGSELFIYAVVGVHYHVNVWQPAMLDNPIRTSYVTYILYLLLFCTAIVFTVTIAKQRRIQKILVGGSSDQDLEDGSSLLSRFMPGSTERSETSKRE
eukprot:Plantae.Rhodophyta-Hildenbrandia_rubra.ctg16527.p1 GENE.Plantae.Rhodophyta-Hildenbrandia_rubra.ctg16527~~Plantae.Rhodophyta-Hildenbrandia_rubra.ctg16527.p1  ORF type:complete len:654 (+),score=148.09 Plantae.Rhodophyta-Hildenbrandia_rubra.ctg16527:3177-5138(+)